MNALSGLRTLYQAEAELLRSFRLLRQTIQQFLMDPTKTAVTHHQNVIARLQQNDLPHRAGGRVLPLHLAGVVKQPHGQIPPSL